MAASSESLNKEPLGAVDEAEGQAKPSDKTEDLLTMVEKLQREGSLEPQIKDLINRINELQQAKKKASEELQEARSLWEVLHRELDSRPRGSRPTSDSPSTSSASAHTPMCPHTQLNPRLVMPAFSSQFRLHLGGPPGCVLSVPNAVIPPRAAPGTPILSSTETLKFLQLHCQEKQRLDIREQLDKLIGQHKDLWEFHMLQRRLVQEIRALESSKEQLLTEEAQVRTKLEEVGCLLSSPPEVVGTPSDRPSLLPEAIALGLKTEMDESAHQAPAQAQGNPEEGKGDADTHLPGEKDPEPVAELATALA
ncbi:synaptonemal complex central element protein 1-like [Rhynchocyon petersi]